MFYGIWYEVYASGGQPNLALFYFPKIGNNNMADL
jgi:hypothetical protein